MMQVIPVHGCEKEKKGEPCMQGEEALLRMNVTVRTEMLHDDDGEIMIGNVVDQETGMPLEQSILHQLPRRQPECYFCGARCRVVMDYERYAERRAGEEDDARREDREGHAYTPEAENDIERILGY